MKRADGRRVCDGSPESMHGAAGAPPQLTDGACVAAQSTDVAALRHTLQARPLALRLHRERAIGAKSTDLCAVDFHVGRAQRADNRGSRMLSRTRAHRASGGPGGGRPSSPPERPWPGSGTKGGVFPSVQTRSYQPICECLAGFVSPRAQLLSRARQSMSCWGLGLLPLCPIPL